MNIQQITNQEVQQWLGDSFYFAGEKNKEIQQNVVTSDAQSKGRALTEQHNSFDQQLNLKINSVPNFLPEFMEKLREKKYQSEKYNKWILLTICITNYHTIIQNSSLKE